MSGFNLERAALAWGAAMPDAVRALAEACDQSSQKAVGKRLKISSSVISQVLNRCYPGDTEAVLDAAAGALLSKTVDCPVDGEITKDICLKSQRAKLVTTSRRRIRLYRTCPTCPNRKGT
ncbi:MAG: hypothetical protein ACPGO3_00250 [Magnetospiraceae bacterium]